MDPSHIIGLLPEPWRTYALAAIFAFLATQMAASFIAAILPASAFVHPVFGRYARGIAAYGHFEPKDAPGTLKLPLRALDPRSVEELGRVAAQGARIAAAIAPVDPSKVPVPITPREGERGAVRVGALLVISGAVILATLAGAALMGCPRLPPVVGCTPLTYRCTDDGRPQVCSSTQRWQPVGDESCAAAGAVCVVDRTAHCAAHAITADAGVSHD